MDFGRIVIISGPPGAGKSSVARRLAECSAVERAVHLHSDDFYNYIRKGYIAPWLTESGNQNKVVMEAFAASAERYAIGGYEVFVDGVLGPSTLGPWLKMAKNGLDVRYVILRPDEETTVKRAAGRTQENDLTDSGPVRHMWRVFEGLGQYEQHVINTADQSIDESVRAVISALASNAMRLPCE